MPRRDPLTSFGSLLADILTYVADSARQDENFDANPVASALRGLRTDSLGLGQVVYFPAVPYSNE